MSMTRSTGNVVPFDTSTPPPTTPPWPPGPWPMPPNMLPGCAPPGAMDGLLGCYYSVQAATAFISAIMIDAINNNPAVADAIIAAIQKSGSNIPLIGVTDGSVAQPGQVGEVVEFNLSQSVTVPSGSTGTPFVFNMGVLQPGSWYLTAAMFPSFGTENANYILTPVPNGFTTGLNGGLASTTSNESYIISQPARADISIPTLLVMTVNLVNTAGVTGTVDMQIFGVRVR